jgi:hypothetical protein
MTDLGTWEHSMIFDKRFESKLYCGEKKSRLTIPINDPTHAKDKVVVIEAEINHCEMISFTHLKRENEQQIRQYVNDVQIDFGDKYI